MITVLFDIDGTLIRSGGAGMIAIAEVMKTMFGTASVAKVAVHGRTDVGILGDLFEAESLKYEDHREAFTPTYVGLLAEALKQTKGEILPGVISLLEECERLEHVAVGVLTGNGKEAALVKLRHFGLERFFLFGGYGDDHRDRNDVAKLARDSAEQHLKDDFDSQQLWVVGDTVADITCARSIGAKVVAVETGGCDPLELKQAEPDLLLANLESSDFLKLLSRHSKVSE